MVFSLASVTGAIVGAIVGVFVARFLLDMVEKQLRAADTSKSPEERDAFERKIVLMRRMIMIGDTLGLAIIGWWVGRLFFE